MKNIETTNPNIEAAIEILKWYCGHDDARQPHNPVIELLGGKLLHLGSELMDANEGDIILMNLESDSLGDGWEVSEESAISLIDWLNNYVIADLRAEA